MKHLILTLFITISQSISAQVFNTLEQDVCDCVWTFKEMEVKMKEANGDDDKFQVILEEYEEKIKKCDNLEKGKNDEEKKLMMEYARNCGDKRENKFPQLNFSSFETEKTVNQDDVCFCVDAFKSMERDMKKAEGNKDAEAKIRQAYEKEREFCKNLDNGLNSEQKDKLLEYAKQCMKKYSDEIEVEEVPAEEGQISQLSVCYCLRAPELKRKELEEAKGDESKTKEIEERYSVEMANCEKGIKKLEETNAKLLIEYVNNCLKETLPNE